MYGASFLIITFGKLKASLSICLFTCGICSSYIWASQRDSDTSFAGIYSMCANICVNSAVLAILKGNPRNKSELLNVK